MTPIAMGLDGLELECREGTLEFVCDYAVLESGLEGLCTGAD